MGALDEFKAFLKQGNVVALAVAFVLGLAFSAVVTSFVNNIVNPIIGIPGHADFSTYQVVVNGSAIRYGAFLNSIIAFIIVALVIFFAVVRPIARMEAWQKTRSASLPPTTKDCPYCLSTIPIKASRCGHCTSQLPPTTAPA